MRATLLPCLMCMVAVAQAPDATFKSSVNLVQVPVVVRDRDGHAVRDLAQGDFELFDNGKRQDIASFAVEAPGQRVVPDRSLPPVNMANRPANRTAAATPERFTAYLFDDCGVGVTDSWASARDAALRQMAALEPGDRVALLSTSGRVQVDFTADRAPLDKALSHLQAQFGLACRVPQNRSLQLTVLRALVNRMAHLPRLRSIVLVSPGFWVGHDRTSQEMEVIDFAVRSGVRIHALDVGPGSSASHPDDAVTGGGYQTPGGYYRPPDPGVLIDLAHGTGGTYVVGGNDLDSGFRKLATPECIYVLGFAPAGKQDGSVHRLKVKVAGARKVSVDFRKEYSASQPAAPVAR